MTNGFFFNDDWLDLQRKYWDGWTEMSRKAMGGAASDAAAQKSLNPWAEMVDQWWRALSPIAPDPSRAFMDKLIDQGKALFEMGERFTGGGASTGVSGFEHWTKTLEEMQRQMTRSFTGFGNDSSMQRMAGFWELPLDTWQRMMSSMSLMPGDALRNMPHDRIKDSFGQALSAPGLGYTREEQAQYQDLMRCGMEYQAALQEYTGFYSRLGLKSVERMGDFIKSVIDSGKPIDSARALYDAWVGCCESVYAEEVSTPEYAQIHGHLINTQMAFKKRMSIIVDENLGALNMPSRSELRTLQDRLQETRRENKRLRQDLHRLERQVQALAGQTETVPTEASQRAAPRKPPVRKKTAAKPASDA